MSKETFSLRLRASMERQGKKQVDLIRAASACGVKLGKSHISQYVSGKTLPRPDILHFLADTLQVDAGWLRVMNQKIQMRALPTILTIQPHNRPLPADQSGRRLLPAVRIRHKYPYKL